MANIVIPNYLAKRLKGTGRNKTCHPINLKLRLYRFFKLHPIKYLNSILKVVKEKLR